MKGIIQYITEKIKISDNDINHIDPIDILNVNIRDFFEFNKVFTDYLNNIYGKSNVDSEYEDKEFFWTMGTIRSPKNSNLKKVKISGICKFYVDQQSDKDNGFVIIAGFVEELGNIIFKHRRKFSNNWSKPIMLLTNYRYKLGKNFLEWIKSIKDLSDARVMSFDEEKQLLNYLKI